MFVETDNPELIAYAKVASPEGDPLPNVVLVVVNLDFHHVQSGWVTTYLGKGSMEYGSIVRVGSAVFTDAYTCWMRFETVLQS